jgi:hypothetical protein
LHQVPSLSSSPSSISSLPTALLAKKSKHLSCQVHGIHEAVAPITVPREKVLLTQTGLSLGESPGCLRGAGPLILSDMRQSDDACVQSPASSAHRPQGIDLANETFQGWDSMLILKQSVRLSALVGSSCTMSLARVGKCGTLTHDAPSRAVRLALTKPFAAGFWKASTKHLGKGPEGGRLPANPLEGFEKAADVHPSKVSLRLQHPAARALTEQ